MPKDRPKDSIADLLAAVQTVDALQAKVLELSELVDVLAENLERLETGVFHLEERVTHLGG